MAPALLLVLTFLVAYLSGSIPFGLLLARWLKGIDIREHGSKNIGATNVGRVCGKQWFFVVLILDALKGLIPTLGVRFLAQQQGWSVSGEHLSVLAGVAAIIGHMFPVWLGFHGGKGVATALGVVACLAPVGTLVAFTSFLVMVMIFRMISLGSLTAAVAFAATQMLVLKEEAFSSEGWPLGLFSIGIPLLVIIQHRSNIRRLLAGTENKLGQKKAEPEASVADQ